jgi:hypothetical protein
MYCAVYTINLYLTISLLSLSLSLSALCLLLMLLSGSSGKGGCCEEVTGGLSIKLLLMITIIKREICSKSYLWAFFPPPYGMWFMCAWSYELLCMIVTRCTIHYSAQTVVHLLFYANVYGAVCHSCVSPRLYYDERHNNEPSGLYRASHDKMTSQHLNPKALHKHLHPQHCISSYNHRKC